MNSHGVDLAHYLVGDIAAVRALMPRFVKERPLAEGRRRMVQWTSNARRSCWRNSKAGRVGTFEATRYATGRRNRNQFEIYGSRGALTFDLERMNELEFYTLDDPAHARGFRTINATEPEHPYAAAWWPPKPHHRVRHAFVHAAADFLAAACGEAADEAISPTASKSCACSK
ncbi:MAG: hypothetical protein R3F11_19935 [Verrucomicrobiales bacterium]